MQLLRRDVRTDHVDAVDDAAGLALHADLDQIRRVGHRRAQTTCGQACQDLASKSGVALAVALVKRLDGRVEA